MHNLYHNINQKPTVIYARTIGLIADYIPFIVDGKKDLSLEVFLPSIQEKVRARRERDNKK